MDAKSFYDYIIERENIRLKKKAGKPWPWTDDPVLREWKFTNVRREHDRTSQELIQHFYSKQGQHSPLTVILLNCATFRYFGTYEFAQAVGWQVDFDPEKIIKLASQRLDNKQRVFTGAYIITNQGIKAPKEEVVVNIFLKELWRNKENIINCLQQTNSWQDVHKELAKIQGFGGSGFMAKEVLLDTMYCNFWLGDGKPDDYWEWTPIGPGGKRGINRVLGNDKDAKISERDCLQAILELTRQQDKYWPKEWGKLAPTDLQFVSCEWDKLNRVRNNEGTPRSRYRHG